MHDLHVLLSLAEHVTLQDIHVLYAFILHQVAETLLLYTGHVEDVGTCNHIFVKVLVLNIFDVVLLAVEFVLFWHGEFFRCDEMEGRIEVAHGCDK